MPKRKMHKLKLQNEEFGNKIMIHKLLPSEIFVKILKNLDYKSISLSRETCKHWKNIIDRFELVKAVMRKYFSQK